MLIKEANNNFIYFKEAWELTLVLSLRGFTNVFAITTSYRRSNNQRQTKDNKPIAYESKMLKCHEFNYPTHDHKLLAIVRALKRWWHYLLGS